jgi:hypothetical protein
VTYEPLATTSLTLGEIDPKSGEFYPVSTTSIVKNNRGQNARVSTQFAPGIPAESETIPGVGSFKKGTIITQHISWGPETADGTRRNRITTSIVADGDGGLSGVIDSTTNDPSGSEGQSHAMPLVFNAGEGKGIYFALYPIDNTISIQDRAHGVSVDRMPMKDLIARLRP